MKLKLLFFIPFVVVYLTLFGQPRPKDSIIIKVVADSIYLENAIEKKAKELIGRRDTISLQTFEAAKEYNNSAKNLTDLIGNWIQVILGVGIFGILGFYWYSINQAKNLYEKKIVEAIKMEEEKIKGLVTKYDIDERLRKESKILILTTNKSLLTDGNPFYESISVFSQVELLEVKADFSDITVIKINKYHAVIIKNENNSEFTYGLSTSEYFYNSKLVQLINESNPETAFIYFGKIFSSDVINYFQTPTTLDSDGNVLTRIDRNQLQYFSYANAYSQLFGNVQNILKYRYIAMIKYNKNPFA